MEIIISKKMIFVNKYIQEAARRPHSHSPSALLHFERVTHRVSVPEPVDPADSSINEFSELKKKGTKW